MVDVVIRIFRTLDSVRRRVKTYARYNKVKSFLRAKDIEEGLEKCNADLDTAMSTFNVGPLIYFQESELIILLR
jgi:hypothetical protein